MVERDDIRERAESAALRWLVHEAKFGKDAQPLSEAFAEFALTERREAEARERERCAKIAEDEDGHFSHWGEDRNTRVAQQTCRDIALAMRGAKRIQSLDTRISEETKAALAAIDKDILTEP